MARRTGLDKAEVEAVRKAHKAGVTGEKVTQREGLSLTDLALLAPYEDDPEAMEFLTAFRSSGDGLKRRIDSWHSAKEDEALMSQAREYWQDKGARLTRKDYDDRRLTPKEVTTREGKPLPQDPEVLAQMPGVELALSIDRRRGKDKDGNNVTEKYVRVEALVSKPSQNGYMKRTTDAQGSILDAEQAKEQRRAATQARNEWGEAEQARRAFIAGLLDAKTPPTGHENIVAAWLAQGNRPNLVQIAPLFHADAAQILRQIKSPRTTAKRRQTLAAVVALMQWEAGTSLTTHKYPDSIDGHMMRALIKAGHQATEAERSITK
ncbi:hypothetical protein VV01_00385 [Luteipulveratus halotolerans]|uniref:Uncharacterized protein n=1 Tax=Luteipulveratus halotolerans TaxID=1631356 RepID=A0A0L6CPN2_9MICO|nr:hypothetical protein VV01_00385 [Luteipulveratus halotolerans]